MVSISLPHSSEESGSSYFLRKQHHKREQAGYLFTYVHLCVNCFFVARNFRAARVPA
jgi:hypothetical protein